MVWERNKEFYMMQNKLIGKIVKTGWKLCTKKLKDIPM